MNETKQILFRDTVWLTSRQNVPIQITCSELEGMLDFLSPRKVGTRNLTKLLSSVLCRSTTLRRTFMYTWHDNINIDNYRNEAQIIYIRRKRKLSLLLIENYFVCYRTSTLSYPRDKVPAATTAATRLSLHCSPGQTSPLHFWF